MAIDIEKPVEDIVTQGLTPETILSLLLAMLVIYIVMLIREFLVGLQAWRGFKHSLNLSLGTVVRMPTSTGYVDGKIIRANRKRIVIEMDDTIKFVPTKTFMERDWDIVKKKNGDGTKPPVE